MEKLELKRNLKRYLFEQKDDQIYSYVTKHNHFDVGKGVTTCTLMAIKRRKYA